MQRFFSRFAWRNLSIPVKTGVLFLFLMLLISLLAVQTLAGQSRLREQLQTSLAASVEMRALAQDLQVNVESLERIEVLLVEQRHGWGSFELTRASLESDYTALVEASQADIERLAELGALIMTEEDFAPLRDQLQEIGSAISDGQGYAGDMFSVISGLTQGRTGALARFDAEGDRLEEATTALASPELLADLVVMRNLERTLINTSGQAELDDLRAASQAYLATYTASFPSAARGDIEQMVLAYIDRAEEVSGQLRRLELTFSAAQNRRGRAREAASRLGAMTEVQRELQLQHVDSVQLNINRLMLGGMVLLLLLGGIVIFFFGRGLSRSAQMLLRLIDQFELGNFDARATVAGQDEFSQLGAGFNAMAEQLQELVGGLEQRVAERTRDLSITANIGHAVTARRDARDLMNEVVELIRQRFGYYHAQVFLIDETGERAELVASTGTAGRELLARRHALDVGSQSVIGAVTAHGEPVVTLDTDSSGVHRRNELLPDTRSEMALPMRIGERVIGALDVQSVAADAFNEDVVAVFQIMADQLAVALENARLQAQLQEMRAAMGALERQMTLDTWNVYRQSRELDAPLGYELNRERVVPRYEPAPSPLETAIQGGQVMVSENGSEITLAVPIKVRGEVIGAFGFGGEHLRGLSEEDLSLVEAVAERVGSALENMRLVEETARRAENEQLLNEVTAKIVGSTDVNHILQTAVRELGRVLRAPQTTVQLRREGASDE